MKMFLIQIRIGQVLLNQNVRSFAFIERQSIFTQIVTSTKRYTQDADFPFRTDK